MAVAAVAVSLTQARSSKRQALAAEDQALVMRRQYAAERRDRADDLKREEEIRIRERAERRTEIARGAAVTLLGSLANLASVIPWLPGGAGACWSARPVHPIR